jgi:hypothetical protein
MLTTRSALQGNVVRYHYPSPADRRHVVNLTSLVRVGSSVRFGAAFTWASGAPFSRFLLLTDSSAFYIESPNAARAGSYAGLDLLLDWTRSVGKVQLGAFLQVRNVLNRANAISYTGSVQQCKLPAPPRLVAVGSEVCDRFDRGVPLLPLGGVRVAF